jgi:uncharacterized membrane protein YkgB
LEDIELQDGHIEIAAFSGSECRGSVTLANYPEIVAHPYLGFLTIHGVDDEVITFKVHILEKGKEYAANNTPVTFTTDAIYGNTVTPYAVAISDFVSQQIPLNEGWTWISTNVNSFEDPLLNQFKVNIGASGILLKDKNTFIQEPYWVGTLREINNREMYMVKTAAAQDLTFTGYSVSPDEVSISLLSGWNWIGYVPSVELPVSEALSKLTPQEGDQIKSHTSYSVYTSGQWVGNLATMNAGKGYKYYSNNANIQALVYPATAQSQQAPEMRSVDEKTVRPQWEFNFSRFPNTMTITSVVEPDNTKLQSNDMEIAAFCGDECRGSVRLKEVSVVANHPYLGFLVIHGESKEEISFRIYDHAEGREYFSTNKLPFVSDAIHGSPAEPYKIVFSTTGVNEVQAQEISAYIQGDKLFIQSGTSTGNVTVYDIAGRPMLNCIQLNDQPVTVSHWPQGVYIVRVNGKTVKVIKN